MSRIDHLHRYASAQRPRPPHVVGLKVLAPPQAAEVCRLQLRRQPVLLLQLLEVIQFPVSRSHASIRDRVKQTSTVSARHI